MQKIKEYFVYILTNQRFTVFYVGQSDNLIHRTWQHKHKLIEGFTKQYNIDKLIYYESHLTLDDALKREKELKGWSRYKKINLIKIMNPEFDDLSDFWWQNKL